MGDSSLAFISGRSNKDLGSEIINSFYEKFSFDCQIPTIITDFANKEIFAKYKESIRGKDVYILQGFGSDPNKDLVETMILADTAFAASAKRITLILPTIYGSRQDRKSSPRTPVTISTVAKMIKSVNVDRVVTVSLHAPQSSAAFFSAGLKFDNISSAHLFLPFMKSFRDKTSDELVVVSPDAGGLGKARYYAEQLGVDLAFADKRRSATNASEVMNFVGEVKGKQCFIVDDIVDTGGSLVNVAEELKNFGAKEINCLATHLVLSKDAVEKLENSPITKIYGTNSIAQNEEIEQASTFEIVSLADTLANVIIRINQNLSVSDAFKGDDIC